LRQHNHSSLDSFLPSFSTLVDKKGLEKFCEYSLNYIKSRSQEKSIEKLVNINNIHNNSFEKKINLDGDKIVTLQTSLVSLADKVSMNPTHLDSFFFK
jgi:hypothetical protein